MRERHHPSRWVSVPLDDRRQLPQKPGVYAVIKRKKIYYIGVSINLNRRWQGKGHHRFAQAEKLGRSRLHYVLLPKHDAKTLEKQLITQYSPPWNYSKVPVALKVNWWQRVLMAATCVWVLFISSRSLILGMVAAVVAIALFRV
ncbi:excinuclease abc c subunit domain-containing protein [Leptolyngbya sp. Heron Island J]|uniref:GIY-YIG nuclease family protein n=1 Tax=Leptolyngbya sp. Heron Island J TaxID=1385935 RepID=UPI0003B9BC04|nr:GIY-YIG nuclease family protein [Leptolyngbya sp. Heron Island J]ESA32221.1 excinuclease abc c subunit domain-containing protein [Leptolyngbya sp. Heron Island J]